ncbi:MAG: hypothetical protein J1E99_06615 [Muribaculaceae bacterium]|nr:hypothetical protein [Muribaculaceae bacterium]
MAKFHSPKDLRQITVAMLLGCYVAKLSSCRGANHQLSVGASTCCATLYFPRTRIHGWLCKEC